MRENRETMSTVTDHKCKNSLCTKSDRHLSTVRCRSRRQHRQAFEITRIFKSGPARPPITCSMTCKVLIYCLHECFQKWNMRTTKRNEAAVSFYLPPHIHTHTNTYNPPTPPSSIRLIQCYAKKWVTEDGYLTCCRVLQVRLFWKPPKTLHDRGARVPALQK